MNAGLAPIATENTAIDPNGQHGLANTLAAELASVLRRMESLDGIGEKAASRAMAALPDARTLGDRMAALDFAFGPGVDHAFASWQLRTDPDEDDPEGEVQTDAALAIMLLNGAVYTNRRRSPLKGVADDPGATGLFADCSDVFAWGCADLEDLQHDQIDELFAYWEKDPAWGAATWCIVQRRELPQRPVLESIRKAGVWDMESLVSEHGLRPNQYDGLSMAIAMRKRDAYVSWCVERGVEPLPFDAGWWAGWKEYVEAHPEWYDASWKAGDAAACDAWMTEHGFS